MSIYRAKRSGIWQFDFQIKGYRFSGSTRTDVEHDAAQIEKAEKDKARALVRSLAQGAQALTIEYACTRWWNEHGQHLAEAADTKQRLDWIVAQLGPNTPLHAISNAHVSELVAARRRDLRRAGRAGGKQLYREISAKTVNKTTIDLLRRVMRRARDNWDAVILREPTWKNHRLKETRRAVRELLPSEDLALDAIEDRDFAELRRFAIITGLRRRNLLLTWSQVDFELGVIRVMTKGGVPRTLPLTREAYALLWRRRGQHPEHVFTFQAQRTRRCPKTGQQFIKGERYPITYFGISSNKRKWKKAGVVARIHDLRHTAGMRTLRATGNLRVVQKLLGHTDIAITAKFYTDATLDDLRDAMETTAALEPLALPAIEHKKSESE